MEKKLEVGEMTSSVSGVLNLRCVLVMKSVCQEAIGCTCLELSGESTQQMGYMRSLRERVLLKK